MSTATENVLIALTGLSGAVVIAALITRFIPARSDQVDRYSAIPLFGGTLVAVTTISAILTAESSISPHARSEYRDGRRDHRLSTEPVAVVP